MKVRIPERIRVLAPYVPGRAEEDVRRRYGLDRVVKLASNENPLGPSPKALEAMARELPHQHRYPEPDGWALRKALAEVHGLTPDHVVLGNGSAELIETAAIAFLEHDENAVVADGGFIIFHTAVQRLNGNRNQVPLRDETHDLEAMAAAANDKTRLLYVANPNNPTGTWVGEQAFEQMLDTIPDDLLVVWDEAYREYLDDPGYPDGIGALKSGRDNLIVLGTFSKAYGLAGLRIGYALCHPDVAVQLHRARSPINTNRLAQAAAIAALGDTQHLERSVAHNREELPRLAAALEERGLRVTPSSCNFVLADTGVNADRLFEALCRHGVIVRPMAPYGWPTRVRISVGLREETALLLAALDETLPEVRGA
jgi:histidinol-phosphate aminotransferase